MLRSNTSVCLKVVDPEIAALDPAEQSAFLKRLVKRLEEEDVAYDIAGYRDAPPGLRIWCGATVDAADLARLTPWLDWAFRAEKAASLDTACVTEAPMPKVLISDKLSEEAAAIFRDRGVEVDFEPDLGKSPEQLAAVIGQYDGLAVRSATKATADLIEKADNLKVIGRAGIGVDNVDIPAASARGVVVMNTPFGNSITTAEHAIAMMFAVARRIPEANASTHAGKWEKSKFTGVEITGKTLGRDRLRQYRLHRRRPRHRAEDEGGRL